MRKFSCQIAVAGEGEKKTTTMVQKWFVLYSIIHCRKGLKTQTTAQQTLLQVCP